MTRKTLVFVCAVLSALTVAPASFAQSDVPWMPPAIAATCERLAQSHERTLRAAAAGPMRTAPLDANALATCFATRSARDGAWLSTARDVTLAPGDRLRPASGIRVLYFISPDGSTITAGEDVLGPFARIRDEQRFFIDDFDRDGRADALFTTTDRSSPAALFSVRSGAIVRASVLSGFESAVADDVDSDGRADLVAEVRFNVPAECTAGPAIDFAEPILRWVALADGARFVTDSDGAKAFVRAQCPSRPTVFVPTTASSSWSLEAQLRPMLRRVACARVWGASPADIAAQLPRRWPSQLQCLPRERIVAFANDVRPPLVLAALPNAVATTPAPRGQDAGRAPFEPGQPVLAQFTLDAATPALRTHCARRAQRVTAFIRSFRGTLAFSLGWLSANSVYFDDMARCHLAGSDAWVDDVSLERAWIDGAIALRGSTRVEFVGRSGRVTSGAKTHVASDGPHRVRWRVIGAFDFDHDGSSEGIVSDRDAYEREARVAVLSARSGAIELYAPSLAVPPAEAVADVDDDGQWDLVYNARAPYPTTVDPPTYARLPTLSLVAHGLPDGTFSLDDAVAREVAERQCSNMPRRFIALDSPTTPYEVPYIESVDAVACARLRGATAEQIVQQIIAELATNDSVTPGDAEALMLQAVWKPPFRLAAAPPRRP